MTTIAERTKRMYGGGAPDYNQPIESFFSRQESRHSYRNDKEGLAKAREARATFAAFAAKHKMTADDVRVFLSTCSDHESHPRSGEAVKALWDRTYEQMAERYGGPDARATAIANVDKFQRDLAVSNAYVAERMLATGAASAPEIVEVCAKYGSKET